MVKIMIITGVPKTTFSSRGTVPKFFFVGRGGVPKKTFLGGPKKYLFLKGISKKTFCGEFPPQKKFRRAPKKLFFWGGGSNFFFFGGGVPKNHKTMNNKETLHLRDTEFKTCGNRCNFFSNFFHFSLSLQHFWNFFAFWN